MYSGLNIPDGEYLHYASKERGKVYAHCYWVTKYETAQNGDLIHRIYLDVHQTTKNTVPDKDYTKWPMYFLVNASNGQLLEAVGICDQDDADNFVAVGVKDIIYWNYKLVKEGVDYTYKSMKDNKVVTNNTFVKFDTEYPSSDMLWGFHFKMRYLDSASGKDVVVGVCPHLTQDPILVSWRQIPGTDVSTMETEAGTFNVRQYRDIFLDPIIGAAFIMFVPGNEKIKYWMEDSDRRLLVKIETIVGEMKLVEYSNVNDLNVAHNSNVADAADRATS